MSILNQLPRFLILLILNLASTAVECKEIIATREWQLLEEGDTVPAGLHIRMDITSGEKWAKLDSDDDGDDVEVVDVVVPASDGESSSSSSVIVNASGDHSVSIIPSNDNDDNNNDNNNKNKKKKDGIKITHLKTTELTPEASAKITSQLLDQERRAEQKAKAKASIAALNDYPQGDADTGEVDVDMMYRALSNLPTTEINRMGGLPVRPTNTNNTNTNSKTNDSSKIAHLKPPTERTPPEATTNTNNNNNTDDDTKTDDDTTAAANEEFETAVRELWNKRQAELKQMEEEYMADAPDLLRTRIKSLTEYVMDPVAQLQRYLDDEAKDTDHSTTTEEEDDDEEEKDDIAWVVDDLEYQLMDIDMARDFHTMGGWPLLVSLLTDSIHGLAVVHDDNTTHHTPTHTSTTTTTRNNNNNNNNNTIPTTTATKRRMIIRNDEEERNVQTLVWKIQGLACSAIGSAVRNIDEFHSWALEDFEDVVRNDNDDTRSGSGGSAGSSATNVLSILVSNIDSYTNTNTTNEDTSITLLPAMWQNDNLFLKKIYRELHALGALLRGNRMAIDTFTSVLDGPLPLRRMIDSILHYHSVIRREEEKEDGDWKMGVYTERLIVRTVTLAVDIVMDVVLHPRTTGEDPQAQAQTLQLQQIDTNTIESFTTTEWCTIPLQILTIPSTTGVSSSIDRMKREMLAAAVGMAPYCSYERSDFDINSIVLTFDLDVDEEDREEDRKELEDVWNQLFEIVVR
mmetsp:Transcript_27672/g.32747  ORF Transcript_27672/g.32747 Transcript_27672/m.32747 type:complete len:741 (-) Transcript_27672:204-2426(-)